MNRTTCPNGMVDTCCENYDDCTLSYYDKDAEIKRLNEKIEFLARTNMLYSDWEHRETQVTSDLIRKGIEEHKINVELRAEIERLKQRTWVGLTGKILISAAQSSLPPDQYEHFVAISEYEPEIYDRLAKAIQFHLKEKNCAG